MKIKNMAYGFMKTVDQQITAMAFITMLWVSYYINPLVHVELAEWNRTFCTAVLAGISIDKRISHFYFLFLLWLPLVFAAAVIIYNLICSIRPLYKELFMRFNILALFPIIAAYISRYEGSGDIVNQNPMVYGILGFYMILWVTALIDQQQKLNFTNLVNLFLGYVITVLSVRILFEVKLSAAIMIAGMLCILYEAAALCFVKTEKIRSVCGKWLSFFVWTPAFIRLLLEGIYFLTEKGKPVQNYFTYITGGALLMLMAAVPLAVFAEKKQMKLDVFLHIGAIVSMGVVLFGKVYQYVWSYSNIPNLYYEYGNVAVAADTIVKGKLPIIDYFSAHSLADVLTKILFGFIYGDVNGIFIDPYGGLVVILGSICLYLLLKHLFGSDIAIMIVCLFPTVVSGVKMTGICFFAMAMLLYIVKNPSFKIYVLYWVVVLFCAFYIYDEGIFLGMGSIVAYGVLCLLQKEWAGLKKFIVSGGMVGLTAAACYVIYGLATGIPVISRCKEWLSVSAGSNSTWATADFGDTSSFAFLVSYFLAPALAVIILVLTIAKFIKSKAAPHIAALTLGFAFAEIFYIPRTVVYQNLAVSLGQTGVLLNFVHWSVAMYVLYAMTVREEEEKKKIFTCLAALGLVIVLEGAFVTDSLPKSESVLYARSLSASWHWNWQEDMAENAGKPRIVFDEESTDYINRFKYLFDTLLTDGQTFLDFANVTSMYALTGRERPSYVGQTPSLLTDLYSQKCYLDEISGFDCPLAIVGTTESQYLQHMAGVPHNVRYYKIAEYIYNNYRPLVRFDEYSIWCEKDKRSGYAAVLSAMEDKGYGYELIDYGYDAAEKNIDEAGNVQFDYKPYHTYGLEMIPYVWANYDKDKAIDNNVQTELDELWTNAFTFGGSQDVVDGNGNYVAFTCNSNSENNVAATIVFWDSNNDVARYQYSFTVVPGSHSYLIRVSQDYFWDIYNIDTISVESDTGVIASEMRILEGD